MLYNAVLRTMATEEKVTTFGVPEQLRGRSVRGRYTTTLQAINSGVIKLSRMQPACKVQTVVQSDSMVHNIQLSTVLCNPEVLSSEWCPIHWRETYSVRSLPEIVCVRSVVCR